MRDDVLYEVESAKETKVIYFNSIFNRREYFTTPRMASIIKNHLASINQFGHGIPVIIIFGVMMLFDLTPSAIVAPLSIIGIILVGVTIKTLMFRKYRRLLKSSEPQLGIKEYFFKLRFPDKKAIFYHIISFTLFIIVCLFLWFKLDPDDRIWIFVSGIIIILADLLF